MKLRNILVEEFFKIYILRLKKRKSNISNCFFNYHEFGNTRFSLSVYHRVFNWWSQTTLTLTFLNADDSKFEFFKLCFPKKRELKKKASFGTDHLEQIIINLW